MGAAVTQAEYGLRLPCKPSSTPIGRGATWATMGRPRAWACSTSANRRRQ